MHVRHKEDQQHRQFIRNQIRTQYRSMVDNEQLEQIAAQEEEAERKERKDKQTIRNAIMKDDDRVSSPGPQEQQQPSFSSSSSSSPSSSSSARRLSSQLERILSSSRFIMQHVVNALQHFFARQVSLTLVLFLLC